MRYYVLLVSLFILRVLKILGGWFKTDFPLFLYKLGGNKMKLNLKYNATKVDEIEQAKKQSIENCISDTTIGNLALFIQKGLIDDNGNHGVSRTVAISTIDNYLEEKDKDELVMDIMEALIDGGFLSRELDVKKLRELKTKRQSQINEQIDNNI